MTDEKEEKMLEEVMKLSLMLVERCDKALVGSNGDSGYPNIKAMNKVITEGLKTFWFSTNTSSKRVAQFIKNPKACVYFANMDGFEGLMLIGEMEVLSDLESRKKLWWDGCEMFYPLGVDDPDYSVLRFTAKSGNYYHDLRNISFDV